MKSKMKGQKIALQILVPSQTNLKTVTKKASEEITLEKEMKNHEQQMGFSAQSSSHNRSPVLSFCLIRSWVKWLTTFKEGLVIILTPFDWTPDWSLRYLEWKWKGLGKICSKSNFLTFRLEAASDLKWRSCCLSVPFPFPFFTEVILFSLWLDV